MLLRSGLWTNWAMARPSKGVLPYRPLVMKMICAPSHVMREGRALNQQGQAGRQEQASSKSPASFQAVLDLASSAEHRLAQRTEEVISAMTIDLVERTRCI